MSFTWRRVAAPIAIGLGPAIIVFAILRNWHHWSAAPFWIDDLVAGLVLSAAGFVGLQEQDSIRGRLISAAFALAVGVLWGSLFEGLAGIHPAPEQWSAVPGVALVLTVAGLAFALIGLIASLPSKRPPFIGTRPEPERRKKTRRAADRISAA